MSEPSEQLALVNLLRDGEREWRAMNAGAPSMADVLECLIREAVETMVAIRVDKPGDLRTAWPEIAAMTQDQIENARNIERQEARSAGRPFDEDLYEYPRRARPQPTAAAMSRFLPTMRLILHVRAKNARLQKERIAMVMAVAKGMPFLMVPDAFRPLGYTNADAARAAYYRSLLQIERGIAPMLPKAFAFDVEVQNIPPGLKIAR